MTEPRMTLKDKIVADMTAAMKAKDAERTSTLRMLKAAITNREKESGTEVSDEDVLKLLRSQVKQRRDSVEHYQKAARQDLVDKETAEITVIESYLPQAASEAEIEQAVSAAIAEAGATSMKEMGAVMKAVMAKLAGKNADGRLVSEAVKKKLA
ncbi:MAG TPA: GatB/YqeY domain-containing protein [Pyrinomonadaceae bacterium]|nr:GatB/YqeY domain-containing protein [Pyrinomonadaceae bacterium]